MILSLKHHQNRSGEARYVAVNNIDIIIIVVDTGRTADPFLPKDSGRLLRYPEYSLSYPELNAAWADGPRGYSGP